MAGSAAAPGAFVTHAGDLFAPPPYRVEPAVFRGFVLDSSYARLDALLDEQLNNVTGGALRFRAVVPAVILTYIHIPRSFSIAADSAQAGYYVENDLMCWVLAAQFRKGQPLPERVGFYAPFVWVDHPAAVIEGREGFGYPKGFGPVSIPRDGAGPYTCDAMVFPGDGSRTLGVQRINTVQRSGDAAGGEEVQKRWSTIGEARADIFAGLVDRPSEHRFAADLTPMNLEREFGLAPQKTFLLRQTRSCEDPSRALLQEIVAAPFGSLVFHGGGLLGGDWTSELPALPALDLPGLLGVEATASVRLAYEVTLETTLALGETLWRWSGSHQVGPPTKPSSPVCRAVASLRSRLGARRSPA
jgi:hypothetical protein